MKKFQFTIRGNKYDSEIISFEDDMSIIEINGTRYEVEVHTNRPIPKTPKLVRKPIPQNTEKVQMSSGSGLHKIEAPLPGTIIQTKVSPGDTVKAGDLVMTMEAMKMENNIFSEKSGIIKEVKVKSGDAVLQGDILIELEMI